MDNSRTKRTEGIEGFSLPEWETTSRHRGEKQSRLPATTDFKAKALTQFDRVLPPHRRYLGLSRNLVCIIFLVIVVVILALIIGLAAGLSHHNRYVWNEH